MTLHTRSHMAEVIVDVQRRAARAQARHGGFASAHEAYAVLKEEVEEYWAEVKKRDHDRDPQRMYQELLDVAAVALRAAEQLRAALGGQVVA